MIRSTIVLVLFLVTFQTYSQKEGQNFCEGITDGSYLPLDIKKKKILWYDTYYFETIVGKKVFNGKTYTEFLQEWKDGQKDLIYLREENNVVFQYREECKEEYVKLDIKATQGWSNTCTPNNYKIIALDGELKTPYCQYKNLVILEAVFEKVTLRFYYQKGYGYVGATKEGKIISCVSPEWKQE